MKQNFIILMLSIIVIVSISLIPLGCDEEQGATDGGPNVSSKTGYIYGPIKPEKGKSGLSLGLVAMDQSSPPEGYVAVSGARVSIDSTRVKTDEKGGFKITGVQPGEHQMVICAAGFQTVVQVVAVSAASTSTVAIETMRVIPEKSIIMKGESLQFAAVGKEPAGNYVPLEGVKWSVLSPKEPATITNAGFLTAKEVGKFKVVAASGKYTGSTEVTCVDPVSASTGILTGQVVLASDTAVAGADIIISGTNLTTLTDEDGKYSIQSVPSDVNLKIFAVKNDILIGSGTVQLEKWKGRSCDIVAISDPPPFQDETASSGVTGETGDTNSVSQAEKIASITGYVLVPSNIDKEGGETAGLTLIQTKVVPKDYMAVSGAKVMLENDPSIFSTTASDGGFTLDGVPYKQDGGPYFVIVSVDGYASIRVPVLYSGEHPIGAAYKMEIWPENPVLINGGIMEFKALVYDRKGQILETPKIDWSIEGDGGEIDPASGMFTALKTGTETINVAYGDVTSRREVTIIDKKESGKLTGIVTDENGKPVKDALVIVNNSHWVGVTNEEGIYVISFIPAGLKQPVTVKLNGKVCGESVVSIGKVEETTRDISIVLPQEEQIYSDGKSSKNSEIPDKPPASIGIKNNSSVKGDVGKGPNKKSDSKETKNNNTNSRDDFPRWPDNNNSEQSKSIYDTKQTDFPRWPVNPSGTPEGK